MTGWKALTTKEKTLTLAYLPVHLLIIEFLAPLLMEKYSLSSAPVTLASYAAGAVYMLLVFGRALRRDFDRLCDRPGMTIVQVLGSYLAMIAFNSVLAIILLSIAGEEIVMNPNNEAIAEAAAESSGPVTAAAVFLAPLVEEPIFRGGVFGTIRNKSRFWAYAVSILSFSLYHVLPYVVVNPIYLVFCLQYFPITFLLCRCYEKTECIWTPILLHMLVNGISMGIIQLI